MLRFLSNYQTPVTQMLRDALLQTEMQNLFNPSIVTNDDGFDVTFRALPKAGERPFHALAMRLTADGERQGEITNLTQLYGARTGFPVADPKLCSLFGETWVTFNSGHFEKPNNVYLAQFGEHKSCVYRMVYADRMEIEKNWAFFVYQNRLHALYSLDPLTILREASRDTDTITFERISDWGSGAGGRTPKEGHSRLAPKMTIGTQLGAVDDTGSNFIFLAHRRFYWRRRRIYVGKPARLTVGVNGFDVTFDKQHWVHSLGDLFGSSVKHNPNLLSCTYFSGVSVLHNQAIVSYGVNDAKFGLAEINAAQWPTTPIQPKEAENDA